jgi:hypothetical protein
MGSRAWQGFKAFLDDMLYSLARKVRLPDTEFLLNLGDWPQVTRTAANGEPTDPVPVFAWYALGLALHSNLYGSYPPAFATLDIAGTSSMAFVVHQCQTPSSYAMDAGARAPTTGRWCCPRTR